MSSLTAVKRLTLQASKMVRHPLDFQPYPTTINKITEPLIVDIDSESIHPLEEVRPEQSIVGEGTHALNNLGHTLLRRSGQLLLYGSLSLLAALSVGVGTFVPEYGPGMEKIATIIKLFGSAVAGVGTTFFILDSYYALRDGLIGRRLVNFNAD